jgi:hypothetical protein
MEENGIMANEKISLIGFYLDDIKQMKNRQWQIAYYFLLLIAAIIGILKGFKIFDQSEKLKNLLFLITIVLGIYGSILLHKTQISLKTYRERLRKIYFEMPDEFRDLWGPLGKASDKDGCKYASYKNGLDLLIALWLVQWIGVTICGIIVFT